MGKLVLPYDIEYMKMIMLQHEETFKQQVYELHRLYQIQRMMMKSMQKSMQNDKNNYIFNKPQKQDPLDEDGSIEIIDETEIELTLGPTSYSCMKNKPTSIAERNSDSIASFSSSSTDSSHKSRVTVVNEPPWLRRALI